jgi:hypothetical protein
MRAGSNDAAVDRSQDGAGGTNPPFVSFVRNTLPRDKRDYFKSGGGMTAPM